MQKIRDFLVPREAYLFRSSIVILVCVNLLSVIGIILWHWNAGMLMLAYWFESAIIGFFTILKMAFSRNLASIPAGSFIRGTRDEDNKRAFLSGASNSFFLVLFKILLIPFFILHFGGFMIAHLMVIMFLFLSSSFDISIIIPSLFSISFLVAALFVSHTYSFYINYLHRREYLQVSLQNLMIAPYRRIIPMHLAIIFGGAVALILSMFFKASEFDNLSFGIAGAMILILLKTIFDIRSHIQEHGKYKL